jgi:hypothetical protein
MLYLGESPSRDAQRRSLDRQRQDARPEDADDALPGRLHGIAWDERTPQPIPLELAQVGQHFLLTRLRLGKPLLGAGALANGVTRAGSGAAATIHTSASITNHSKFHTLALGRKRALAGRVELSPGRTRSL